MKNLPNYKLDETMKFTFKTEKPTGRYRSFDEEHYTIKYNKNEVGMITSDFKIKLMIIKDKDHDDGNKNCEWMWVTLQYKGDDLKDTKDFLNRNIKAILNKYTLREITD